MAAGTPRLSHEERFDIALGFNTEAAQNELEDYRNAFKRDFERIRKLNERFNRRMWMSSKVYYQKQSTAARAEEAALAEKNKANKNLEQLYGRLTAAVQRVGRAEQSGDEVSKRGAKRQLEAVQGLIDKYTEMRDEADQEIKNVQYAMAEDFGSKISEAFSPDTRQLGTDIADVFTNVAGKDGVKLGTSIANSFAKMASIGMKKSGSWLQSIDRQRNKGKVDDKGNPKVGFLGQIGGLVNTFGKLLPIFKMIGSSFMGLVQMFLDGDATAKNFNKAILSTSGNLAFLKQSFNQVLPASNRMDTALDGIRQAAFAFDNIGLGIKSEDYEATIGELTSAGMTLVDLQKEANQAYATVNNLDVGEVAEDTNKATEAMANLTKSTMHMAVAYSRSMGVSLQEVSAMMGEMRGSMGMPLESIKMAFGKVAMEAEDSGIAANQFFNIIRGMSADINLFGLRMEVAAKMLGKVSKVMDPRKAAQFMQTIGGFFKERDLQSRLKDVMMIGTKKTKIILQEDLETNIKGLAGELEASGLDEGMLREAIAGGMKNLGSWFNTYGKELTAGQRDAIAEAAMMSQQIASGSAINLAAALKNVSPLGAIEAISQKSTNVIGVGIRNLQDVELLAATNAIELSEQQIAELKKAFTAFDMAKYEIADRIESGNELSAEDLATIKALKLQGTRQEMAQKLRDMESLKVVKATSKETQDVLTKNLSMEGLSKEQADKQTSLLDKIDELLKFVQTQIYNALNGIWRIVARWFENDEEIQLQQLAEKSAKKGQKALSTAAASAGNLGQLRQNLLSKDKDSFLQQMNQNYDEIGQNLSKLTDASKKTTKDLEAAEARQADLVKKYEGAKGKKERDDLTKQLGLVANQIQALKDKNTQISDAKNQIRQARLDVVSQVTGKAIQSQGIGAMVGPQGSLTTMEGWGGKTGEMAKEVREVFQAEYQRRKSTVGEPMATSEAPKLLQEALKQVFAHSGEQEVADFSKFLSEQSIFKIDPKALAAIAPQLADNLPDIRKMAEKAMTPGSIYTHDMHLEPLLGSIATTLETMNANASDAAAVSKSREAQDLASDMVSEQEVTHATLADIYNVLRVKGIQISSQQLDGKIKTVLTESSRTAMESALFEYALLTDNKVAMDALNRMYAQTSGRGDLSPAALLQSTLTEAQKSIKSGGYQKAQAAESATEAATTAATPSSSAPTAPAAPVSPAAGNLGYWEAELTIHLEPTKALTDFIEKLDYIQTTRFKAQRRR